MTVTAGREHPGAPVISHCVMDGMADYDILLALGGRCIRELWRINQTAVRERTEHELDDTFLPQFLRDVIATTNRNLNAPGWVPWAPDGGS